MKTCSALLLGGAVCLGGACSKKQELEPTWHSSDARAAALAQEAEASTGPQTVAAPEDDDWVSGPPTSRTHDGTDPAIADAVDANVAITEQATVAPVSRTGRDEIPEGRRIAELEDVRFALDDDSLDTDAMIRVRVVADYLRDKPSLAVTLRGHTDESGTEGYNLALGSRRAEVVRDALIQRGISADRIETVSFGKLQPLDTSGTEEARARNRRVEFFVWEQ